MTVETNPQLSAVAFAVGIVALLWVLRRTLLRVNVKAMDPDKLSFRLRALAALRQIDIISDRVHFERSRRAVRFFRTQTSFTISQRELLASVRARQQSVRRGLG